LKRRERRRHRVRDARDPAVDDELQRDGIQVVERAAPPGQGGHEVRPLQQPQVLHHAEARHPEVPAQVPQRAPVARAQEVEEVTARPVGQRTEDQLHR
jgi:hypothetical protein